MILTTRYILAFIFLLLSVLLIVHFTGSQRRKESFNQRFSKRQNVIDSNSTKTGHRFYQPFKWTLLPKTCSPNVKTLIIVHSANEYSLFRKAIRETYGSKKYEDMFNFRLLFAIGKSQNKTREAMLREEFAQFNDILQADFYDSYKNLTIKYLMWMRYVRDYCPRVDLVLKMDDDVLVNLFWLFEDIQAGKLQASRMFTCRLNRGAVFRDSTHKWYVSKEAMPEDKWPIYCSGMAVIQDAKMSRELIRQAEMEEHYISVDDAFITGTLAEKIGAHHDFNLYGIKYVEDPRFGEMALLSRETIFVTVTSTSEIRRLFGQLEFFYAMKTDPPDYLL